MGFRLEDKLQAETATLEVTSWLIDQAGLGGGKCNIVKVPTVFAICICRFAPRSLFSSKTTFSHQ